MDVACPLHVLDPLVGLALRVDHQRPPTGIAGEGSGGGGVDESLVGEPSLTCLYVAVVQ